MVDSGLSADTKLEVLNAHYENTFEGIQATLKRRDRFFAWIVVFVVLLLLQLVAPEEIDQILTSVARDRLGLAEAPDISVIGSAIWFVILGLVVRYFQTVVHVERQYEYIHGIEELPVLLGRFRTASAQFVKRALAIDHRKISEVLGIQRQLHGILHRESGLEHGSAIPDAGDQLPNVRFPLDAFDDHPAQR